MNISKYFKIFMAAVFMGLTIYAVHEKYTVFALGFSVATWSAIRNMAKKDKPAFADRARRDACQYCDPWQLECEQRASEKPTAKPKKPTDHKFN